VPGSLCEQLRHQLVPNSSGLSAACKTLEMPVAIPSSLHARVMSLLQTGCVEEANPSELVAQDVVVVPARVSTVGVKLHQDRYGGEERGLVKGLVVVVYIAGGGTMTFVDERSGHVQRQVDIVPGRLIAWDNTQLLHKVDVGDTAEPRVMLGPMSIAMDAATASEEESFMQNHSGHTAPPAVLVRVGEGGGGDGGGGGGGDGGGYDGGGDGGGYDGGGYDGGYDNGGGYNNHNSHGEQHIAGLAR